MWMYRSGGFGSLAILFSNRVVQSGSSELVMSYVLARACVRAYGSDECK